MAVNTSAGTVVSVSQVAPATFDGPGYLALNWTPVGEVTNAGEFGREYEKVEHKPLASRATGKRKGGYDDGAIALAMGLDEADPGQLILASYAERDAELYLRVDRPGGAVSFMPVVVFSFRRMFGERGAIVGASASLEITSVAGVGIVGAVANSGTTDFSDPANGGVFVALIL